MSGIKLSGLTTKEKLMKLITLRSTTPPIDVMPVAEALAEFAKDTGADVEMQEVQPGKPNCLLTYTWGAGKTLAFNTHMDVNNPEGQIWHYDPFVPQDIEGRIYGLGACDAKGSLAAMLTALENLKKHPEGLRGQLVLTAVMGEEAGGLGTLFLTQHGFHADSAIVGEPTELALCTVHKGTYMRRVTFRGKAVHSARSKEGINAINHTAQFCLQYEGLQRKLDRFSHPILGSANASVTLISGGTRQNTIPESCTVMIDRRLIPGETAQKADKELDDILSNLKKEIPSLHPYVEVVVSTVPSETNTDSKIVRDSLSAIDSVLHNTPKPTGFCGGCDMSKLVHIAHVPTVIFGPGSMQNAHSPDEYVETKQLDQAALIYETIARDFLSE